MDTEGYTSEDHPEVINLTASGSASPPPKKSRVDNGGVNLDEMVGVLLENSQPALKKLPPGFQNYVLSNSVRWRHNHFPSVMLGMPEIVDIIDIVAVRTLSEFVTKLIKLGLIGKNEVCIFVGAEQVVTCLLGAPTPTSDTPRTRFSVLLQPRSRVCCLWCCC